VSIWRKDPKAGSGGVGHPATGCDKTGYPLTNSLRQTNRDQAEPLGDHEVNDRGLFILGRIRTSFAATRMSAFGTKRTSQDGCYLSAFGAKADISQRLPDNGDL
jgi:hypothetical protein